MNNVDRFFDPDEEVDGCSPADLKAIEKLYGHPLPEEYVHVVTRYAGYNGFLRDLDGEEAQQYRIADRETIEQERNGYAVFELDFPDALPIAGMDAWRLLLAPREDGNGSRYLDVDLGSGDVLGEHDTIESFLTEQVSPEPEPSTPFGTPVDVLQAQVPAHWSDVLTSRRRPAPAAVLAELDLPDDLRDFLEHHDGFDGQYTVAPYERKIVLQLGRAQTYRSRRSWARILDAFPDALVLGGWDTSFPICVNREGDGWAWFRPYADPASPVKPFQRLGSTFCEFLAANRARCEE